MKKRIAIIGGGASGCMLASLLNEKFDISIFEKNDRILHKVLQSGNGMCNLTNEALNNINILKDKYNKDLKEVFEVFDLNKCKEVFESLGLLLKSDSEGRYYPYSKKASNVYEVLNREMNKKGVKIYTNTEIENIKREDDFILNNKYHFDYVAISSGSISSLKKYNGYDLIRHLGLKIVEVRPSLVGFKVKENIKSISGLRIKSNVSLYLEGKRIEEDFGEVQFKDEGVSGIVVMELSRLYDKMKNAYLSLDLAKDYSEKDLYNILNKLYKKYNTYEDVLISILPKMIALDIIKRSKDLKGIVRNIKAYILNIKETYGFEYSQVTRGGLDLSEIDLKTFASKRIKGLYFTGEVLDVDGTCGGFNLHFAWASAYIASLNLNKCVGE